MVGPYRGAISKKLIRAPDSQKLLEAAERTKKAMVAPLLDLTQGRGTKNMDEKKTPVAEGQKE